jgi:hypothetical protein
MYISKIERVDRAEDPVGAFALRVHVNQLSSLICIDQCQRWVMCAVSHGRTRYLYMATIIRLLNLLLIDINTLPNRY